MERSTGVTIVSGLFLVAAAYLFGAGLVMLASPGLNSMAAGAQLMDGLELAGPYMFLLIGGFGGLIGWGLLGLHNWSRRVAIVAATVGIVFLIPSVSAAAVDFRWSLVWGGLGIMIRAAVIWYLSQSWVAEQFSKPAPSA